MRVSSCAQNICIAHSHIRVSAAAELATKDFSSEDDGLEGNDGDRHHRYRSRSSASNLLCPRAKLRSHVPVLVASTMPSLLSPCDLDIAPSSPFDSCWQGWEHLGAQIPDLGVFGLNVCGTSRARS